MSWTDFYDTEPRKKRVKRKTDDRSRKIYGDSMPPRDVDIIKKWRPTHVRPRPVAGKPNPFVMESVRAFARGEIDREELSYRLRFGHAKR